MHLVNDNCRKFIDTVNTKVKELNCEFIIKEDPYTSLEELYNTFNQENKTGNLNYENKNNPHIEWIFDNDNVLYIDRNIIKYRYSKKTLFKNKVLENSIDISMINENDVYSQIYHILEKSKILYERQKTLEGL